MAVKVLVLRAAGTNCDKETAYAFEKAGAKTELVHINRLMEDRKQILKYRIMAIPGGFTYGDDIASGKILANEIKYRLGDIVHQFVDRGGVILGICNGFQVLVKMGILPGIAACITEKPEATLTFNDSHKFEDRWITLGCPTDRCIFVKKGAKIRLPIAHGEGKFVAGDADILKGIVDSGRVVFEYVDSTGAPTQEYPANPNGSQAAIAGICDDTGRVMGLMPHPERFVEPMQSPDWTRTGLGRHGDGFSIFENAVGYFD